MDILWNYTLRRSKVPTPRMVIGNSEQNGVSQRPKYLRESLEQNWKYQGGGGGGGWEV